jgi:hypothetical protein
VEWSLVLLTCEGGGKGEGGGTFCVQLIFDSVCLFRAVLKEYAKGQEVEELEVKLHVDLENNVTK